MPDFEFRESVDPSRCLATISGDRAGRYRMLATSLLGHEVFIRELLPQDLKLELDQLTRSEATAGAHFLAMVVGKAHGRQMDIATRKKWVAELNRNRSKSLDAPSWLWKSVVELISIHESAYLHHCRLYTMRKTA